MILLDECHCAYRFWSLTDSLELGAVIGTVALFFSAHGHFARKRKQRELAALRSREVDDEGRRWRQ